MRSAIVIAALGLAACDDGKDTGAEEPTAVAEGAWSAEEVSEEDTCGFFGEDDGGEDDGGPIVLTMLSETSFSFSDGTEDFDLTCELAEDLSFTCPGGSDTQSLDGKGLEATITSQISYSGAFDSRTSGAFVIQIDVTCDGGDCLKLKKYEGIVFPCGYTAELAISHAE